MLEAVTTAVRNDARLVVNGLERLPSDWVVQIRAAVAPRPLADE